MTTGITGIEGMSTRAASARAVAAIHSRSMPKVAGRPNSLAAWLVLIGLILPAWEMTVYFSGAKFTAGRLGVTLLFVPALVVLCQRGRRFLMSDLFALITAAWILIAAVSTAGSSSLSSAGAESLEFIASYVAARAFFSSPAALDNFIRVLKALAIVAIALAIADSISSRWIAHDVAAAIFGTSPLGPVFRENMIRATSTFDHPILFGIFCGLVAAILLLWETNPLRRIFYVGLCLVGCVLSQSSAALMCFMLVLAAYAYDRLMRQIPSRWIVFWTIIVTILAFVFLLSNNPIGWLISHLTLDPETGYYRILIWNAALDRISQSPFTGYSLDAFNQQILDATIDSVWLVMALRFGVPTIVSLFLANVTACLPAKPSYQKSASNIYAKRMRLAFTIVLLMFMFVGLTVHFWNYMWIFWGVCIGIRASLREMSADASRPALQ